MDFTSRGSQPHQAQNTVSKPIPESDGEQRHKKNNEKVSMWTRWATIVLLVGVAILLIAVAFSVYFGGAKSESTYLVKNNFQAVDVSVGGSNGGDQIYFGNITNLNSKYFVLDNVYYIPSTGSQSGNITLQPLVCQIDSPIDRMVINRSSVNWWENLQNNSKVVQTIQNYEKKNPNGPSCPTSSTNSSTSSTATTKSTATTPTSTSTTPKP